MRLALVLTHACDLRCRYCYTGEKKGVHMNLATARRALDLGFANPGAVLHLSFFGGEPLLNWSVLEATAKDALARGAAQGVPLTLQVTTNGSLLDQARAERLHELGVYVALSFDGEAQDATRPRVDGSPSSPATRRALDLLLERPESFSVILVVDPATVDTMAGSVRAMFDSGVDRVVLNPNWGAAWSEADLERWSAAYRTIAALQLAWARRGRVVFVEPLDTAVQARAKGRRDIGERCDAGLNSIAVAPSGRLYGCGRQVGEDDGRLAIGTLDGGGVVVAAGHPAGAVPAECDACGASPRCERHCACACREETGNPSRPGPILCWHQHLLESLTCDEP